jgi:hypothetical protein
MKTLPFHLHRNGVFYDQIQRTDSVAIYSLRYEQGGRIIGFDVFRIRLMGGSVFNGKSMPPYEKFPGNSAFGKSAWSFTTKEAALRRFSDLITLPRCMVGSQAAGLSA